MTYINAQELTQDARTVLMQWLQSEGIDPSQVADDGKFSVHKGVVSGNKFLTGEDEKPLLSGNKLVTVHFRQVQKNPLPEVLT